MYENYFDLSFDRNDFFGASWEVNPTFKYFPKQDEVYCIAKQCLSLFRSFSVTHISILKLCHLQKSFSLNKSPTVFPYENRLKNVQSEKFTEQNALQRILEFREFINGKLYGNAYFDRHFSLFC